MLKQLNLSKEKGIGSLNLTKGISLNLTKGNDSLKSIKIGLGWQTRMDLDSVAVLIDKDNNIVDTIYFANQKGTGIQLHGDNLTGGKKGDSEVISATLDKIPENVMKICLFANIFSFFGISSKSFGNVRQSYIRLVNDKTKQELCRYSLEDEFKNYSAVHFADLVRDNNNDWSFVTIGKGLNGSISDIKKYCLTGKIKKVNKLTKIFIKILETIGFLILLIFFFL